MGADDRALFWVYWACFGGYIGLFGVEWDHI